MIRYQKVKAELFLPKYCFVPFNLILYSPMDSFRPLFQLISACGIIAFCSSGCYSQNQSNVWYFGNHAGLSFTDSSVTVLTDGLINNTPSSTISDSAGNLLFYTNGDSVWNASHIPIANGFGLADGSPHLLVSTIITPKPGTLFEYYIFTLIRISSDYTLSYSLVNMSLNGGAGEVTWKNVLVMDSTSTRLTAIRHGNGEDLWLVTQQTNSSLYQAFHISDAGIGTPVVSDIPPSWFDERGQFKASPDGG